MRDARGGVHGRQLLLEEVGMPQEAPGEAAARATAAAVCWTQRDGWLGRWGKEEGRDANRNITAEIFAIWL